MLEPGKTYVITEIDERDGFFGEDWVVGSEVRALAPDEHNTWSQRDPLGRPAYETPDGSWKCGWCYVEGRGIECFGCVRYEEKEPPEIDVELDDGSW